MRPPKSLLQSQCPWVRQEREPPCPSPLPGPHLDLQLLHHLHLNAALGRAPVVQGVLCVEVSSGEEGAEKRKLARVFLLSPPSHPIL